jgi:hypothetical protein
MLLLVAGWLIAASCGADRRSAADDRLVAVYSAVIRGVVTQPGAPRPHLSESVFVKGAHSAMPLEVQAGVVDALHDFATIRFIDDRSEAIDDADPRKAVRDGGVLVVMGLVPPGHDDVVIEAQRYQRTDNSVTYVIRLHRSDSTWKIARISAR